MQSLSFNLIYLQYIEWNQIQHHFVQTQNIISSFTKFKDQVRKRKISMQNYKTSRHFYVMAEDEINCTQTSVNKQQESIINTLLTIIPPLQNYIRESFHPAYLKNKKRHKSSQSTTQLSYHKNIIPHPQESKETSIDFEQRQNHRITTVKNGYFNQRRTESSRSSSTVSINKKMEYQQRVQIAQQSRISRLDKILGLKVKKPVVESSFKQERTPSSKKVNEKSLLIEELEKNKQEIKKIAREEQKFKWQVERETKEILRQEMKERELDDIYRYRKQKDILELNLNKQSQRRNKENSDWNEYISKKLEDEELCHLKNELMNSQRIKEEIQERYLKTITNCQKKY